MQLRSVGLVSVCLVGALLPIAAWAGEASIVVGTATGVPGERMRVSVTIRTDDTGLYGEQNDLQFDGPGVFAPSADGDGTLPDCELGPDLAAGEVGGAFLFPGGSCGSPTGCADVLTRVVGRYAQIPDGTTLYTCSIDIAADAALGSYAIECLDPEAASLSGGNHELPVSCIGGMVNVVGGPAPTPTPSTVAAPTSTPTPTAVHIPGETPAVELGRTSGGPGQTVVLTARLVGIGETTIAGVQADIAFDSDVAVRETDGHPDCTPGTSPNLAGFSGFAFLQRSCGADGGCTGMRAVIAPTELMAIPDGAVLFTCEIDIAADAVPRTYPLTLSNVIGSDLRGNALLVGGRNGAVTVRVTGAGSVATNPSMGSGCGVVPGGATSPVAMLGIAAALLLVRRPCWTPRVRLVAFSDAKDRP